MYDDSNTVNEHHKCISVYIPSIEDILPVVKNHKLFGHKFHFALYVVIGIS